MDFGSEVEDDKGYLDELKGEDEEKKEDDLNKDSELEEEKDFEDDQIKSGEFEGDLDQELPEEKEESIWDEIDWSEDKQVEREKTIWDEIDWSEDKQVEREKNEKDKNNDQNDEYNKEDYVENVESQSVSTVLINKIEEIENNVEHQEQEEEIEIRPEECQDTEPIVDTDEIKFIKEVEELAEHAREINAEDEIVEPQAEKENAAYYAEQYYEALKEKEVLNDQNSKEEQEAEELRQEVTEELKADQESGYKSDELEEEDIIEESKEITNTEEFEYLWEVRDKLDREGKPLEEIEEVMHEAEEMYETLKNAEKLYEEQEHEKLKLVDHEDEATEEDLKEDLDRVDLVEQAVELEEKMVQRGGSQEEIDARVEESIEKTIETDEFEEKLEKIIEAQELEKLKLVDHEDEEEIDDVREEIDRPAEAEYYMEVEEELHRQGMSQEEIDEQMEEITSNYQKEINKKQEKEENLNMSEELEKHDLETNEQNSSAEQCDQIELTSALSSEKKEESEKEENESLQELYRQETGRRPIYGRQKSKGYSQWLEQRELRSEKIKITKSESESEKKKEIEEEGWKRTLKRWIKEASEEECNAELKSELKKALKSYNEFEYLTRKFLELYEESQHEKLTEIEKNRLKSLMGRLQELRPIQLELLSNIRAFKDYFNNHLWELMNRFFVNRARSKFLSRISQKYKILERELNFKKENKEIRYGEQKRVRHPSLKKGIIESDHYNKWLTENIQKYLKNLNPKTRLLFEPFIEFKNMGALFGLYKNYIPTNRTFKNYKKIIARSILDEMRVNFKKVIENWINKYPHLIHSLLLIQTDIIKFIDEYEAILQPKPTPNYQMFNHHPNFKRDYFEIIDTNEKAYWLGFLFADGYITIEHKKKKDYYRMGLQLSYKDKDILYRFCENIGLNLEYINDRLVGCDFSTKLYPTSEIRWGDQKLAQDLINLGMKYEFCEQKGRRVKTPRLPNLLNRNLMLAFLLGFYDGDGTLGFDKKTEKIRPRIASLDREFLQQVRDYFGVKYNISSTTIVKFNIRKEEMYKALCSRIEIDKEIFKGMLSIYNKSLERKRVSLDFFT